MAIKLTPRINQSRFSEFSEAILGLPTDRELTATELCVDSLLLEQSGDVAIYYVPFEAVNPSARLVIVGITPGIQQMAIACRTARDGLLAGDTIEEIMQRIESTASFAGSMRRNLIKMLNELGLAEALSLQSSADLFAERAELLQSLSVVRDAVIVDGENYTGHKPKLLRHPSLRRYVDGRLASELEAMPDALIVPCGKAVDEALAHLVASSRLDARRCLIGFPHPSGANGHRVKTFEENRDAMKAVVAGWFGI